MERGWNGRGDAVLKSVLQLTKFVPNKSLAKAVKRSNCDKQREWEGEREGGRGKERRATNKTNGRNCQWTRTNANDTEGQQQQKLRELKTSIQRNVTTTTITRRTTKKSNKNKNKWWNNSKKKATTGACVEGRWERGGKTVINKTCVCFWRKKLKIENWLKWRNALEE